MVSPPWLAGCWFSTMMASQKVVIPAKAGVQVILHRLEPLDSGFRRNDRKQSFLAFYEFTNHHLPY